MLWRAHSGSSTGRGHRNKKGAGRDGGEIDPAVAGPARKVLPYSLKLTPTAKVRPFLYWPIGAYFTPLYQ